MGDSLPGMLFFLFHLHVFYAISDLSTTKCLLLIFKFFLNFVLDPDSLKTLSISASEISSHPLAVIIICLSLSYVIYKFPF